MSFSKEQFVGLHHANVEAGLALGTILLGSAERLYALGSNFGRTLLESQAEQGKKVLAAQHPAELLQLQAAAAAPGVERSLQYLRSIYDLSAQTHEDIGRLVEARYGALSQTLDSLLDSVSRSAPTSSEAAVSAVRSTIKAVNATFAHLNETARQVAELTEANVAAASNATVKTVAAHAPAPKRKVA